MSTTGQKPRKMRWFRKLASSSPTFSAPSLSSISSLDFLSQKKNPSPTPSHSHNCSHFANSRSCSDTHGGCPKLTRGRKLRHLTDEDLLIISSVSHSQPCIPSDFDSSRSVSPSTPSPSPLPLPLPEPTIKSYFGSKRNAKRKEQKDNAATKPKVSSSPASPFSSPIIYSSPELFPYLKQIANGEHGWSAPELAAIDMQGRPPPAFLDLSALNPPSPPPIQSPPSSTPPRSPNIEVHPLPLPPGASPPSSSRPLKTVWQKGKLIGRGTFGSVYVASNRISGALCAMKEVEIFPDDPNSAECISQLEQEIKILSQLQHRNIVHYYGSETVDDHFYIYLEYVHPGSINKYVHEHGQAITEYVVRSFTRHIVSGLAYLHSKKTVHRDIKGANLLVDSSGVVKLADFGMSKLLSGQWAHLSMKGSPYWMAPELITQKDNSSELAFAVDIWSLGCTIIEMFTGKPPWSEYEGPAAMFKVMSDTPPFPESLSVDGKDFLGCCLRRNPAERLTAFMLLEHRWLRSAQLDDGMKSTDAFYSAGGI